MLGDLFERFFRESAALLIRYVQHAGLDLSPSPEADRIFDSYFAYFETKRDLLRIMLMESLKSGEQAPAVFKLVDFGGLVDDDIASSVRDSGLYPAETMSFTLVPPLRGEPRGVEAAFQPGHGDDPRSLPSHDAQAGVRKGTVVMCRFLCSKDN